MPPPPPNPNLKKTGLAWSIQITRITYACHCVHTHANPADLSYMVSDSEHVSDFVPRSINEITQKFPLTANRRQPHVVVPWKRTPIPRAWSRDWSRVFPGFLFVVSCMVHACPGLVFPVGCYKLPPCSLCKWRSVLSRCLPAIYRLELFQFVPAVGVFIYL